LQLRVVDEGEQVFLEWNIGGVLGGTPTELVTTARLGGTQVSKLPFEDREGSPLSIDRDYFAMRRDALGPTAGPFERAAGADTRVRVW
jgi:alpha-L-arabinofuranosidase